MTVVVFYWHQATEKGETRVCHVPASECSQQKAALGWRGFSECSQQKAVLGWRGFSECSRQYALLGWRGFSECSRQKMGPGLA